MGKNSLIEWTDHSWSPWIGCQKISPGCAHCYAEEMMTRKGRWADTWGPTTTSRRVRTSEAHWQEPLRWQRQAQAEGQRVRVFPSLCDPFERNDDLVNWRWDFVDLMMGTPNIDWLLLTKRPENILDMVPWQWYRREWEDKYSGYVGWPKNVWIGVSVEDQEQADRRIPELLEIPAAGRFLSCEPLLGQINFDALPCPNGCAGKMQDGKPFYCNVDGCECERPGRSDFYLNGISWVIVGGESGSKARPMHPDWARSLRDQCRMAAVPFFFKQWGEWIPDNQWDWNKGVSPDEDKFYGWPDRSISLMVGKKAAGRLLDGREWSEGPR